MGVLVSFARSAPASHAVAEGHSAAILFFTGVRYVRPDEVTPYLAACATAKPARKRRRSPRVRPADHLAQA